MVGSGSRYDGRGCSSHALNAVANLDTGRHRTNWYGMLDIGTL